VPSARR